MIARPARRIVHGAAVLTASFVATFLLLQALPGDPFDRLDAPGLTAEDARRTREALGLDLPVHRRLVATARSYLEGDLGVSFERQRPVARVLGAALPATLLLGGTGLLLAYGLGVPLAVAAWRLGPRARAGIDRLALLFTVTPRFWFGVLLVWVFHGWAGWLPASHAAPPGGGGAWDRAAHLVLPALTLALPAAAGIARYQLAQMAREADRLHVVAARAAGAGGARMVFRSLVRPTLVPVAAMFALDLRVVASGALVVELVFAWPGIGRVAADAVRNADYPLALAAATLSAALVVVGRAIAEVAVEVLDPRAGVRSGRGR